jgi:hypothetical protein
MDAAGAVQGVDAGRGALAPPSVRGNLDPRLQSEGLRQRRLASASSLESCSEENANERSSPGDLHLGIGSLLTPLLAARYGTKLTVALVSVPH